MPKPGKKLPSPRRLIAVAFPAITENELDVKVPTAASATEQKVANQPAVINVRKDGTVVMERKELTLDKLREKLRGLSEVDPDFAVVLRGDKQLPFENLVAVMDVCRQANIYNMAFATGTVTKQK